MPYLLYLSITFHKGSKWGDSPQKAILSILSAPKLHYLRINGSPGTPHPRNVLPPLASFPSLHTLRLEHFEFVNPYSQNKNILIDPTYFRETSSVRHLQLVQTSLFSLNPVGRDERDNTGAGDLIRDLTTATAIPLPISLPSGPIPFPLLDTVTLYSSRSYNSNDVMWLCELVANRGPHASLSSSIKRVYLSKSSMRDCRRSYQKDKSNSNNNSNSNSNSGNRERGLEGSTEDGHFTLEEWLRDRVEVCELDVENERDEDDA
ncbi:hypothetical protein K435DRAFT_778203 [Dendrothele bispora CBS 962.96]|uniref:F-box domain-containing protein n=1 Tax=Dendrothele bispora (strain CBS 962.96) TaxID=1314807 RepID=A0A4S8M4Q8_DENBC|nr:hypothetical protein K435DRAFT_778203 [Dendrothele bispora CBS 962.96]